MSQKSKSRAVKEKYGGKKAKAESPDSLVLTLPKISNQRVLEMLEGKRRWEAFFKAFERGF